MFNIILYHMNTENNRMDKTNYLTQIAELSGTFREATSVIDPSITFEFTQDMTDLENGVLDCNYLYIPYFKRYYFVDNIVAVTDKLWQIDCSVDVLMTFKDQLVELDVFCDRNEFNFDKYLPDNKVPSELRGAVIVSPYVTVNSGTVNIGTKQNPDFRPKAGDYILDPTYDGINIDDMYAVVTTCDGANKSVGNKIIKSTPHNRCYALTLRSLDDLSLYLFTTSFFEGFKQMFINPADGIKSIIVFPFRIDKNVTTALANNPSRMMFGSYDSEQLGHLIADTVLGFWGGEIEVNNNMSIEFLNYEPYSSAQLYIPYYGYVDIPLNICIDTKLRLWYHIDITTGDTSIEILCFPKNSQGEYTLSNFLLKIVSCNIGINIPISSSNFMSNTIKNIIKGVAGVGNALMMASGSEKSIVGERSETTKINYSKKTGKVSSINKTYSPAQTIEKPTFDENSFINKASDCVVGNMLSINSTCNLGTSNSTNSIFGLLQELHIVYRGVRVSSTLDINKYAHLVGRPSSYNGKLKNLKGYTELGGFHLEGLKNCTKIEQNEINSILRSGFLMSDPE